MSAREGSLWVEDEKLAYTDERGEKKSLDFDGVDESGTEDTETSSSSQTSSDGFSFSIDSTNTPRLPGAFEVVVSVTNENDSREYKDIIYIFDGDMDDIRENVAFDAGEERQFTFSTFIESFSEVSSETPSFRIGTETSGVCSEGSLEVPNTFDVDIISTNSPINPGETLDVTADITNQDAVDDSQIIQLDVGGENRDFFNMSLEAFQEKRRILSWSDAQPGKYTAKYFSETDSDTVDVVVNASDGSAFFAVTIDKILVPDTEPTDIEVYATIENIGNEPDTQTIELSSEDSVKDSQTISLNDGESQELTFIWSDVNVGLYDLTVSSTDDSDENFEKIAVKTTGVYFKVLIKQTNAPVAKGETVEVEADIYNLGNTEGTQTVLMKDIGFLKPKILDFREITLDSVGSDSVTRETFTYRIPSDWIGVKTISLFTEDTEDTIAISVSNISGGGGDSGGDDDGDGSAESPKAGIIVHEEPENTLEGVFVDKEAWVEIYGQEIHFSQT
jgi:hypothetical protein